MTVNNPISAKPANRLSRQDFVLHPIWEWALVEANGAKADESFVRPVVSQAIPLGEFQQYLVSAIAVLKDGAEFPACVEVSVHGRQIRFNPLFVFLLDRQLDFVSNETDRLLSRYTKHLGNRPVKWKLIPMIEGEQNPRKGRVARSLLYLFASFGLSLAMRKHPSRDS